MDKKLTSIEGKRQEQSELRKAVNHIVEGFKEYQDYYEVRSKLKKHYYNHLIKEGFSKEQALEIVKSDQAT